MTDRNPQTQKTPSDRAAQKADAGREKSPREGTRKDESTEGNNKR